MTSHVSEAQGLSEGITRTCGREAELHSCKSSGASDAAPRSHQAALETRSMGKMGRGRIL
jgi:hypothetical protein